MRPETHSPTSPRIPEDPSNAMSIAVVTETYPPEINGVANTMRHLVEGLIERGHRVQLVRPKQAGEHQSRESTPRGMRLHRVPGLPIPGYPGLRFGLPVFWRLRRLWHGDPVDLVYIATQGPLGHAALSAAQAHGIPTVTGFHTQFQQYSEHYGLGLFDQQIGKTLQHFHNRSDTTLVPTTQLQADLLARGFHDVHVFGRGVDIDLFNPARRDPALRREWGCDAETLALLYVGRLAPEKNLELACAAHAAILARHPRTRLILIGDGPERERIRHHHPEIICPGSRVGTALAAAYASADLFLFPSLTETFGNVVPEAMASGLPVLAFDDAAAHTLIRPWENGVTQSPNDPEAFIAAALELAQDRPRLLRLGQEARETAEGISWDRVIQGVETRLHRVIAERRARTANPLKTAALAD
ncbi:glycoside hydrolase [Thiocapsa imhoffii]|uniref:Glycoside hydrolase n=1 Tax=Thiocapsa imhoffii TaxID=382777 RepID=A0A9X0WJ72_9GAMM|nr:glycosyltransferase family 1 protein [Thiocapsa imhoffii]MBK1645721.1 glycoside hydrolase [Thiocapsa imhoffii]